MQDMQNIQNIIIIALAVFNVILMVMILTERRPRSAPLPAPVTKPKRSLLIRFFIAIGLLREVVRVENDAVVSGEVEPPEEEEERGAHSNNPQSFRAIMKKRSEYEEGIRRMAKLYMTITKLYTVEQRIILTRDQIERIVLMVLRLRILVSEDSDYPKLKGFFQIYGSMRAIIGHAEKTGVARRGGNSSLDKTLERFSQILGDQGEVTMEEIEKADFGQSTVDAIRKLLFQKETH